MRRRLFLQGAGVLTVLVAGGGVWRAYDRGVFSAGEGPAYEPWESWRDASHGSLALVRAAILAASPHNTQPWLFKVTDSQIELYADTRRNIGMFDPYLREMHIGLGCALENLMLAAAANGYSAVAAMLPGRLEPIPAKREPGLVARVLLASGQREQNELYDAIPRRHTNRGPYELGRPVPAAAIDAMHHLADGEPDLKVFFFTTDAERNKVGGVLVKATEYISTDAQMVQDSERWGRGTWSDVQKFRDGLTIDAAGLPPLMTAVAKVMPRLPAERTYRYWVEQTRDVHAAKTPLFGLIAVRDRYDQQQNLRAGRIWQRTHLWATAQGLAAQPINQAVEVVDRERTLHKEPREVGLLTELTGEAAWQPTFMFRMGYPVRPSPPSPRRSVQDVLV